MSEETTWLEDIHTVSSNLSGIAYELSDLANAFRAVGNNVISEDLVDMSKCLHAESKRVSCAAGKCLNADLKRSNDMSGTILEAVIGGMAHEAEKCSDCPGVSS